jgi:uncharacterized protein
MTMNDTGTALDPKPQRPSRSIPSSRVLALTAAAALLVGIVVAPNVIGHSAAADPTTSPDHTVTVSGMGQVSVAPDVADVMIGVMVQKPTVAAAQSSAATQMTAVLAAVKKDGVADKDIVTTDVSLSPVYDYSSGGSAPRLVAQQFSNTVKVTVRNLQSLAAAVDDAIAAGATTVNSVSFRLDDPTQIQAQARLLAMRDARAKADELTSAAGTSVKGVATITETTTQVSPVYYASAALDSKAAGVSTPIQTGSTDIVVQVTVSYLIG